MMNVRRVWWIAGIVCAVLLGAALSYGPGLAVALPDDPEPPLVGVGEELPHTVNHFCEMLDSEGVPSGEHPVGSRLAEAFDVPYETVMGWFCDDEMGFGQIMLALTTAQASDDDTDTADDYLVERAAGRGWGQIWQDLGLIGRGRAKDDGENNEVTAPDDAGPSEGPGRPEDAGRPDDPGGRGNRGGSNGVGPGENRGLHLGANKPKGGNRP